VAIVAVMWLARLIAPIAGAGPTTEFFVRILGGYAGGAAVVVWWTFFSRAPWAERLGVLALMIAAAAGTWFVGDKSIAVWLLWYSVPLLSLALVVSLAASRGLADRSRRAAVAAAIILTCAAATPFRIVGVTGNGVAQFQWRWAETAEERLLARAGEDHLDATPEPPRSAPDMPAPAISAAAAPANSGAPAAVSTVPGASVFATTPVAASAKNPIVRWPGFRGYDRNGIIPGVQIGTDWSASPPVELWRRPVGPGWSSFAVAGDTFYTQEQRGEDEIVSAYSVGSGEPLWRHRDPVRFDEAMGGAGPRATPTLANDRVYTFGATGILNALDAADGHVVWSRKAASDLGVAIPVWGFSSSPLVAGDLVVIAAGGKLAAYSLADGEPRWVGPDGGDSYSSPQWTTIDGIDQILLLTASGTISVDPADGQELWRHAWNSSLPIVPIVQPARMEDGSVLLGDSLLGVRRIVVAHNDGGWMVDERWRSNRLKPYFNDFILHRGHAYGFDGSILACIDLADGARKWKGGRYGQGQLVLLPDQDLLLVLAEEGDLALVKAIPGEFAEVARIPAIKGKTWNHPVLAGDVLLVRNGEEMAAFRLSLMRP
jgi:outer membrane protein assembly factor BamB